jgi:hypothetical protein
MIHGIIYSYSIPDTKYQAKKMQIGYLIVLKLNWLCSTGMTYNYFAINVIVKDKNATEDPVIV